MLVNGGDCYERDVTRWNLSLLLQHARDRPASTSAPIIHRHGKLFICQHYCLLLENKARVSYKFFCAHQQKLAFRVNEECLRHNYIKNMEVTKA